jgi:tRNA 2-thiouridine synthesizing protein A
LTELPDANEVILDAKGLKCPLPVLRARKAIRDVPDGGLLRVLATDPSAVADFQAYCEATGHELAGWHEDAGVYEFLIRPMA